MLLLCKLAQSTNVNMNGPLKYKKHIAQPRRKEAADCWSSRTNNASLSHAVQYVVCETGLMFSGKNQETAAQCRNK